MYIKDIKNPLFYGNERFIGALGINLALFYNIPRVKRATLVLQASLAFFHSFFAALRYELKRGLLPPCAVRAIDTFPPLIRFKRAAAVAAFLLISRETSGLADQTADCDI